MLGNLYDALAGFGGHRCDMKPRIYVETSVISYLAARPRADAVKATRQHFPYRLWQKRGQCDLLASRAVLAEASAAARRNIEMALADIDAPVPVIATPEEILESMK